ncbi:ECF transporter S component [Bacillota bacterium LX-D]|nr:ECF transporter S component [Bacillota bacterium LX-D]
MDLISKNNKPKIHPSVIAAWAALIAVAYMLPVIPLVVTGGYFTVSAAFLPLAGIFFGPFMGALCAAIGSFIGQIIAPQAAWLGLGTFVIGTVNALTAGFISRGKWPYAVGIILIGFGLWYSTAIGRAALVYPFIVYGLGVLTAVVGGIFGSKWLKGNNYRLKLLAIWLIAFTAFIGAAGIGNYLGIIVKQTPAQVYKALVFVTPLERTIFALGSAFIGLPLLAALPKIGIFIEPGSDRQKFI